MLTVCAAAVLLRPARSRPRSRRRAQPAAAGRRSRHRDRRVRHHRRRRHRAGAVPVLVHREGLCAIHRPARRQRRRGRRARAAGSASCTSTSPARWSSTRWPRRLLPARRRRAAPHGPGAGGARHDRECCRRSTRKRSATGRSGSSTPAPSSRSTGRSSRRRPRTRGCSPTRAHRRPVRRATTPEARRHGATGSSSCWRCCRRCSTGSSNRRCGWWWPAALAQALMLPLIGLAALYLRHTRLPADIRPRSPRPSCCGSRRR